MPTLDFLTRKVGGVPIWVLVVIAGGAGAAFFIIRSHMQASSTGTTDASGVTDTTGTDTYNSQDYAAQSAYMSGLDSGYGGPLPGGATGSLFYGGGAPAAYPPDYRTDPALVARLSQIAKTNVAQAREITALRKRDAVLTKERATPIRRK